MTYLIRIRNIYIEQNMCFRIQQNKSYFVTARRHFCLSGGRNSLQEVEYSVQSSVGHLTRKSGVLGSITGLATYFRFSFRFFKKGSCQLLAKVCARITG